MPPVPDESDRIAPLTATVHGALAVEQVKRNTPPVLSPTGEPSAVEYVAHAVAGCAAARDVHGGDAVVRVGGVTGLWPWWPSWRFQALPSQPLRSLLSPDEPVSPCEVAGVTCVVSTGVVVVVVVGSLFFVLPGGGGPCRRTRCQ